MGFPSIKEMLYYTVRVLHVIVNNIIAIPAYTVWYFLLKPILLFNPKLFWVLESILFKALLSFVVMWMNTGGYKLTESGDDLSSLFDQPALLLANHQSTADTPVVMSVLLPKKLVIGQVMWIMEHVFLYTNFGWAAYLHGDFFIQQGKDVRLEQLNRLKDHLLNSYLKSSKRWIVLFPEGGFLRKRRERGQRYAKKNKLPILEHCTLPRLGAVSTIMDTVGDTIKPNGNKGNVDQHCIKWVVDVTIAYPKQEPMDIHGICIGYWSPRNIMVHYRAYPMSSIPIDTKGRTKWLYDRQVEKEEMLDKFYKNETFLDETDTQRRILPRMIRKEAPFDMVWFLISYGFYAVSAYIFWLYIYLPILNICAYFLNLMC